MPIPPVQRSILLSAPVEVVWRFVVDEEYLSAWFGGDMRLEAHRGGRVCLRHPDGTRLDGVVDIVVPRRRIVFTWWPEHRHRSLGTRISLLLEARGEQTRLRVSEAPATEPPVTVTWSEPSAVVPGSVRDLPLAPSVTTGLRTALR